LVIARAGTLEHLDGYFDKAKSSDKVGNWHRLGEINFRQPQGRLLFVYLTYYGLSGDDYLYYDGRFVGVAPEVCERSEVDLGTKRSGVTEAPVGARK
ncbi:MAG: hypothetical protein KJ955_01325, partial [Nanoarchaeota archaeon]|nr:hypothetical protein [Nanoarchaeota archaeon]